MADLLEAGEPSSGEAHEEDGEEDGQEEEGRNDMMMVDLDELDEVEKELLLNYLQQEYVKNPEQFPFPREQL